MKLVTQTGSGNTTRFFMSKNNENTDGSDVIKKRCVIRENKRNASFFKLFKFFKHKTKKNFEKSSFIKKNVALFQRTNATPNLLNINSFSNFFIPNEEIYCLGSDLFSHYPLLKRV
jgi:hypothetical protein